MGNDLKINIVDNDACVRLSQDAEVLPAGLKNVIKACETCEAELAKCPAAAGLSEVAAKVVATVKELYVGITPSVADLCETIERCAVAAKGLKDLEESNALVDMI